MAEFFKERRFSIDPGKGKKMDGCPYSTFEDGRDVKEYIIPPKGYIFKGFRFDPDASNQIYDGRLIAEYEKESFNDVLKSNLWKFLLALAIIAVIGVVVILALGVFKDPKPKQPKDPKPNVVAVDTVAATDSVAETTPEVKPEEPVVPTTEVTTEEETPTVVEETKPQEEPQPVADDPNELFKKSFWELIHQRTIQMDPYDILYKDNKDKASGEEFDYLRHTILQDFSHFKDWSAKLRKIPASELEGINTIADLKSKLNTIE
jgi:hypothetical protein